MDIKIAQQMTITELVLENQKLKLDAQREAEHHDRMVGELEKVYKERDEARHEINIIRNALSHNGQAVGDGDHDYSIIEMIENLMQSKDYFIRKSDSFERERDEAREVVREMWQSGDAFLPYIDQETITRWRKVAGWEETK